ncbi:MAG: hypothetical protein NUV97_00475 [archaeon]|nr:hypothetical protein [archaeon]MCR4324024.1 hypothetical protein [Nanoarchaeota archaeon]
MEPRKVQSKKRYLWSFIIGTAIFLLGFAITYSVAYLEFQRVSSLQGPLSYKIFEDKLQFSLFNQDICDGTTYSEVSNDLAFQGSIIGELEEKMGKNNENVLFRKQFYTLVLLEHLELVNTINKECGKKINTILFFYSNEKEDLKLSEDVGGILGVLHERHKDNLFIYSLDMNLNSTLIDSLNERYSVSAPMKIILNGKYVFDSLNGLDEIEPLLN